MSKKEEVTPIATEVTSAYGTSMVVVDNTEETPLVVEASQERGQEPVWRDVPFSILFVLHLGVIIFFGAAFAPAGFRDIRVEHLNATLVEQIIAQSDDTTDEDIQSFRDFTAQLEGAVEAVMEFIAVYPARIFMYLVVPSMVLAFIFGVYGAASILKSYPVSIVKLCLFMSLTYTAGVFLVGAILSGSIVMYALTALFGLIVTYFISRAWKLIPFAAVNLKFALTGIVKNSGIFIVAMAFSVLGFLWVIFWFYVVTGTAAHFVVECQKEHPELAQKMLADDATLAEESMCDPPSILMLFFLLSLYWTSAVLMHTMHVAVAGVMATWCLDKSEANTGCSPAISGSLYRSVTYSFGSICLGSLFQAIIAVLRTMVEQARARRQQGGDEDVCISILLCLVECIVNLLEDLLIAFNEWAYVYVGLYGFGYIESGKRVMELFRARGFTTIITNSLVGYVLGTTVFMVAVLTGVSGILVELLFTEEDENSYLFGDLPVPVGWAFAISFLIGLWVASVVVNVVKGAVNTLIVCWADSPAALEAQHPELTKELADTWRSVFAITTNQPAHAAVVV